MIRTVASIFGILLVLATFAASQQAEDKRARHQQLTRAARLARTANQPATDEAGSTLTANPPSPAPAQPATGVAPVPAPNRNLNPNPNPTPNPTAPAALQPPAAPSNAQEQPLTDQPPTPPQVTFRNGLLSVQAVNSTLGSVLTAIRNKAGIQFEGLEGGASERVAVVLGPSPAGDVLAAILSGSQFDFVALDRPDSPGIVQRVILSRRGGSAAVTAAAGRSVPTRTSSEDDEADVPEEQAGGDPDVPQDTPARAPTLQAQPQMQMNPQPNPQQQPPPTQEQLFQELQRMQQQRLQQQQQQPPPDSSHRTPP